MRPRVLLAFLPLLLLLTGPPAAAASRITWKLSFSDDFKGNKINEAAWSVYGKGGPVSPGCRDAKNVAVANGMATLKTIPSNMCDGFTAAGMCACPVATQVYGKFEVRMKATTGNSKITLLMWPDGTWPPEIDFAEFPDSGDGMLRQMFNETLHYGSNNSQIHTSTTADMTKWHVVGLEWSPGLISYTLDGAVIHTITSHVPTVKMWLGIQTGGSPGVTPATTYVDWVHVYTYSA